MMRHLSAFVLLSVLTLAPLVAAPAAGLDDAVPGLLATGRVDEALAALRGELNSSPNNAVAHNLRCRAYFSLGQWDRGISDCEKAVELVPDNSQFHMWLGRIYGEKADKAGFMTAAGLAGKVREQFEAAVRLDPNNVEARTDLAEFYLEAPGIVGGGKDKAQVQADALLRLEPARGHWVNGRLAEKRKDYVAAEKEYRDALEATHGSASNWLNLGVFYKHRERWDEMEQTLTHVRNAPLDRPDALVDAADVLIRAQRNLPEAVQLLRAYLKSSAKVEQAPAFKVHYLLGTADEKLGDREGAAAEYRSALDLAHEFQPAQQALERVNR
jgi:tetratricopeptide (TPR) repeat protein